ncbi:APC membrane recruitment protein 2 [Thalassophryne amazonica]|uniref:APC membrane recruitment protein 2 n=1 Tax=Thalassophryne amazonica TaxID=390379 RepID=UPI001470FE66|nr:APC membrane recruitment protein 2 [Thalassophryne amazonica]
MDVQMENTDPPPGESQPSGKIRKGFKLFGKRKAGSIFSIRSKGDGNKKSPVIGSKNQNGSSEPTAADSELESEHGKGQEVSQGESEQAEEEHVGEDGVLAAAPPRASVSSTGSAKSLSFLSLLRGGRRGAGDRRVQTVSQPVERQRRGLKGLFGSVRFRVKDREGQEETPPSPLLMSSRTNSVEIIKEDLPLTPKSQSRSVGSPKSEPAKELTLQDSSATSLSEKLTLQVTSGNKTNEHVTPLPTPEPPMVPGDNSLSSLLADLSSLLTFDSISGGGDIIADVEAEWGKASSIISAAVTEVTSPSATLLPKTTTSTPLTSTLMSMATSVKPSPLAFSNTSPTISFTSTTKTTSASSPNAKPSITSTSVKSSSFTTSSVTSSMDSSPATESTCVPPKPMSTLIPPTKPLTPPVTLTSVSTPLISATPVTLKSTASSTSTLTTAPLKSTAAVIQTPSISPTLTSSSAKVATEITALPQITTPVSTSSHVAPPPPASTKAPLAHSPHLTHSPPAKLNSTVCLNSQTTSSNIPPQVLIAEESKLSVPVASMDTLTTQISAPVPIVSPKMATVPTSRPITTSVPVSFSKPPPSLGLVEFSAVSPSPVRDLCSSSTPPITASTKTQPCPAYEQTPPSLDRISTTTVSLDKMQHASTSSLQFESPAVIAKASPSPPAQVTKLLPAAASSASLTPAPLLGEAPAPAKIKASGLSIVDGRLAMLSSADAHGAQVSSSKTDELQIDSRSNLQASTKERRTQPAKAAGLSKIPVVGGGRSGKLPVRDNQHVDNEGGVDPPTPVLQEEHLFSPHDEGSKDKIIDVEVKVPTSKQTHEENQGAHQQKVVTSTPRDSKIPVKHAAQSHGQTKEAPRTKIPVSKVPVRRSGNKTAAASGSTQIRK